MKKSLGPSDKDVTPEGRRVADLRAVFERIRAMLTARIELIDLGKAKDSDELRALASDLKELNATQVALGKAEEAYDAKYGDSADDDAADYEAVRLEIGRRLDRIRNAQATGRVHQEPDGG